MKIFNETKKLAEREKFYTAKLLKNLMIIEKDKLYSDLKYPSLHKYIVKELNYSDAQATVRVNATRLMLKSKLAEKLIVEDKLSLTSAAEVNKSLGSFTKTDKEKYQIEGPRNQANNFTDALVKIASKTSSRGYKDYIADHFEKERQEVLVLKEYMLKKLDRLRLKYVKESETYHGEISNYELLEIMLERELKAPSIRERSKQNTNEKDRPAAAAKLSAHNTKQSGREKNISKVSRYISKKVKLQTYTGICMNCKTMHNLEYDHKLKFSHGGSSRSGNIQVLCRSCNSRKETQARQSGFFT